MKKKVKFIRNGAPFFLSYIAGAEAEIDSIKAAELEALGVVEVLNAPKKKITVSKSATLKQTRKKK